MPPPDEVRQRTALKAAVAAGVLLLALGAVAQSCSFGFTRRPAMETYLRLGPAEGAAALERDLARDHPAGSGVGPVLSRLSGLGFTCGTAAEGSTCRFRARLEERRIAAVTVEVAHDGVLVRGIAAAMTVAGP